MTTPAPWFALPTEPVVDATVVVLGAGLAGCHTAFELAKRNIKVLLLDAGHCIANGASGNSVGIVKPFVARSHSLSNEFYTAAFDYLLHRLESNPSLHERAEFKACGVLQLLERHYPSDPSYRMCSPKQASQIAGIPIDREAIFFSRGGYLNPQALCTAMLEHDNIDVQLNVCVKHIKRTDSQWFLNIENPLATAANMAGVSAQHKTIKCKTLILANGENIKQFDQTRELPITAARGQTSHFLLDTLKNSNTQEHSEQSYQLQTVVTGKRYAIPVNNGVVVGATFTRDDKNKQLTSADHDQNRQGLKTLLPSLDILDEAVSGFCGIRATTPDRLPVVGPVPDFDAYRLDYKLIKNGLPASRFVNARYQKDLFVIGGFGSRGIVSAPYCAMLLADHIDKPSTLAEADIDTDVNTLSIWSTLLHPARFIIRSLKRDAQSMQPGKQSSH